MLLFMTISFHMFPDCVLGPGIWVMGNGKCNFIFGFWWLEGDSHPYLHLLQPVRLQSSPQGAARDALFSHLGGLTNNSKRWRSRPWPLSPRRTLISKDSWQKKSGGENCGKRKRKSSWWRRHPTLPEEHLSHHLQNTGLGIKNRDHYCFLSEESRRS